jgi:hypothetical protein
MMMIFLNTFLELFKKNLYPTKTLKEGNKEKGMNE